MVWSLFGPWRSAVRQPRVLVDGDEYQEKRDADEHGNNNLGGRPTVLGPESFGLVAYLPAPFS